MKGKSLFKQYWQLIPVLLGGVALVSSSVFALAEVRGKYASVSANNDVFWASPNPIQVCDGSGVGNTVLSWDIPSGTQVEVHKDGENGPIVAQGVGMGSQAISGVAANSNYRLIAVVTNYQWTYNRKTRQWERYASVERTQVAQVTVKHNTTGCFSQPAAAQNKLIVATSHSLVQPGGYYILYASEPVGNDIRAFSGQLDYKLSFCPKATPTACSESSGPWLATQNGEVQADIPVGSPEGVYYAQFRPAGKNNIPWSNTVQINVGPKNFTYGLDDMKDYWIFPDAEKRYVGRNNVTGTEYETAIGYRQIPASNNCSWMPQGTREMYFMKTNQDGYWGPNYNGTVPGGDGGLGNLLWYIAPFMQKDSWNNEYLTAVGHRGFKTLVDNPADRLVLSKNFTQQDHSFVYGSNDPRYPGYILAPRWVGSGYGVVNFKQTYLGNDTGVNMCSLPSYTGQRGIGTWVVHIDKVNLNLPKYNGPAMRISFWELQGSEIHERWYFVKNVGLVRIEQKIFETGGCGRDGDCFNKENPTMAHPMNVMTLKQYMQ